MRILIVGGRGTIGRCVSAHYAKQHEVLIAGRSAGDIRVDITDVNAIQEMFAATGKIDALVCAAGEAKWAPFAELTEADFYVGLKSKLMGQVNLVRIGQAYLKTGGSITLTTGILADHPVDMTTSAAMVNGGIHSFVKAVSLELVNGLRINVVSPGLVEDAVQKYEAYFPGHNPIPMKKVLNAYVRSIEGKRSGQVITIYDRT